MASMAWTLPDADNLWQDISCEGNGGTQQGKFWSKTASPACIVGKAHQEIRPWSREHAQQPLKRVYMDIMSSSVTSNERFNYALINADYDTVGFMVWKIWKKQMRQLELAWKMDMLYITNQSEACVANIDSTMLGNWRVQTWDLKENIESLCVKNFCCGLWAFGNIRMVLQDSWSTQSWLCFWIEHKWLSKD